MVHVRNLFLSVDPYMRGRMNDGKVLHSAVRARCADGRRGAWRSDRIAGPRASLRATSSFTWPAGATRRCLPRQAAQKFPDIDGVEPPGVPRRARNAGRDRLFRPARCRPGQGRRHRLRFRRCRRGRLGSGADGQGQGHDRDRLGARRRTNANSSVSLGADAAIDYTAAPIFQGAARGRAGRHRRLFRQCRRRSSRRRIRPRPAQCALRDVRDDRRL